MDMYKSVIENLMPGIDIWDPRYDYVMHDDHWLTSQWSPDCKKCLAQGKRLPPPVPPVFAKPVTAKETANTTSTFTTNSVTTSSPVRNSSSMNSTSEPTLKNSIIHQNNINTSPTPAAPPPITIAMTPIAPAHVSTRAFVTPFTGSKYGHETFNRSTRQSARKLLTQNQDLIDLNETFDLYRSALADTPQLEHEPQPPPQQQQASHQQPATSRIPKIPLRLSRP